MTNTESTLRCSKCERPLTSNANFCTYCGATLQLASEQSYASEEFIGQTIDGTFRIEALIGTGSMGEVYRAAHHQLGIPVAIKVLQQSLITDDVVLKRFKREAQAASRLHHPNTIKVHNYGQTPSGAPYIAMEYLEGKDLSELVAEEFPLDLDRVVSITAQVASALDQAHALGIIHRDLKPANIVAVQKRGRELVKVLDFGIAKVQGTESEGLTRDGLICGTPAFMSPEQVSGKEVTAQSDLFSLGAILYFLLTGKLPFAGTSAVDMATSILLDEPTLPSKVRLDVHVPKAIDAFCMRALAKDAEKRYSNAKAFEIALNQAYEEARATGDIKKKARIIGQRNSKQQAIVGNVNAATMVNMQAFGASTPLKGKRNRSTGLYIAIAIVGLLVGLGISFALALSASDEEEESPPEVEEKDTPNAHGEHDLNAAQDVAPVDLGHAKNPSPPKKSVDLKATLAALSKGAAAGPGAHLAAPPPPKKDNKKERKRARKERAKKAHEKAKSLLRKNAREALKYAKEAVDLSKRNYKYWETLGEAYLRVADQKRAAKAFKKVLELKPDHKRRAILEKKIQAGGL